MNIETLNLAQILHAEEDDVLTIPYVLTRKLEWQLSDPAPPLMRIFNPNDDGHWRFMLYHTLDMSFYLGFHFIALRRVFIIYTVYATIEEVTSTYEVKMHLEESNAVNPEKLFFQGRIFSIEELEELQIGELPDSRYWMIPLDEMEKFLAYKRNLIDEKWTVSIPLFIDEFIQIESED